MSSVPTSMQRGSVSVKVRRSHWKGTYVVGDVTEWFGGFVGRTGDDVIEVPLPDHDVCLEDASKGGNLHVVAVGAALGHALQVGVKDTLDVGGGGGGGVDGAGEGTGILPLWIAAGASARADFDELLVVVGMIPHVIDDCSTNSDMMFLGAVELVGEGVEEAISCKVRRDLALDT